MKNLLFLLVCIIFSNAFVFAQNSEFCGIIEYRYSTDSAYLYEEDYKMFFTENYSYSEEQVEGQRSTTLKSEETEQGVLTKHISGRNNLTSKFYYFDNENLFFRDNYYDELLLVKEAEPTQKWTLLNESKDISGFSVHKATTQYRGRKYTAWYTPEIPLPYGPWKFNGLPGLILEVYDQDKIFYLSAKRININQNQLCELPINKNSLKNAMSLEQYLNEREQIIDEVFARLSALQPKGSPPLKRDTSCEGCKSGKVEIFEN